MSRGSADGASFSFQRLYIMVTLAKRRVQEGPSAPARPEWFPVPTVRTGNLPSVFDITYNPKFMAYITREQAGGGARVWNLA